jgi:hypothetical protein
MQPDPIRTPPPFFRWLLALMAAVQIALAAVMLWAVPEGWTSIFRLPVSVWQVGMAALLPVGLLAWLRPGNRALAAGYGGLARLRRVRGTAVLPLALLIGAGYLMGGGWAGHILLGGQLALLALALYLADPGVWAGSRDPLSAAALLAVLAAGVIVRLLAIRLGAFGDEGFYVSTAVNLVHGGGIAPAAMRLPDSFLHRPDWGRLLIVYGWWARLFGTSLAATRALGFTLGLGALAALYAAARSWYDRQAALVTTGLAALTFMGIQSVSARNTALPMLGVAITLALYAWAEKQERLWPHLLVGLLAVPLTFETHLITAALPAALGGLYAIDALRGLRQDGRWQVRRLLRPVPLWLFAVGLLPGLALYVWQHMLSLPDPAENLAVMRAFATSGSAINPPWLFPAGIRLQFGELWQSAPTEVVLIGCSLAAALRRRTQADRRWLLLAGLYELAFLLVQPHGWINIGYSSTALPVLMLGSGALVGGLRRDGRTSRAWTRASALLSAAILLGMAIRLLAEMNGYNRYQNAAVGAALAIVREQIAPGETVVAWPNEVAHLDEYNALFPPALPEARLSSLLAGRDNDGYWLDIYLETWPAAFIDYSYSAPRESPDAAAGGPGDTLLAARGYTHPADYLWLAGPEMFTPAPPNGAAIQIGATGEAAGPAAPGETITIPTIWVSRGELPGSAEAALWLADAAGEVRQVGRQAVVDAITGQAAGDWTPCRFHRVELVYTIPQDAPAGRAALRVAIEAAGGGSLCEPDCMVEIGAVEVSP